MGLGEGDSAALCSLPEMALRVLRGFAHGRSTGRTRACKDPFMHRCALSEVGRASHTAGIRGVTPVVQPGIPSLVKRQLSEENRAATAPGTAAGLPLWPEMSCPCPQVAPSSAPSDHAQLAIPWEDMHHLHAYIHVYEGILGNCRWCQSYTLKLVTGLVGRVIFCPSL